MDQEVSYIIENITEKSLVIIDELGRGYISSQSSHKDHLEHLTSMELHSHFLSPNIFSQVVHFLFL
jgi:hypothetical protein